MASYWEEDEEKDDDDWNEDEDEENIDDEEWEDDGEGDGWGQDIGAGYGKDTYFDDRAMIDSENEEREEPEQELDLQADKKRKKEEQNAQKGKKSKKDKKSLEGVDEKKLKNIAKSLGFPTLAQKFPCPGCHKHSIFMDKFSGQFKRALTSAIIAMPSQGTIVRYVCLNPKCRLYFPKSGVKFSWDGAILKAHKNIFHVVK